MASMSNQNLGPQFARVSDMSHWTSADFETPMGDVPDVLRDREQSHGSGQDYVGESGRRMNVDGYVDELAHSIRTHGWQEPIQVHADNVVTDGHHRYAAAVRAGLTHVPVDWKPDPWFKSR